MTTEKMDALAKQLNDSINIPIIGEKVEQKIFQEFVLKANSTLRDGLSPEVYGYLSNADEGIGEEEKDAIKSEVFQLLQGKINIPIVKGKVEELLLGELSEKLSTAMMKGQSV